MAIKKFDSCIENKLNELYYTGTVVFHRWELQSWFGVERITKNVWIEIQDKWTQWAESGWFDGNEAPDIKVIFSSPASADQKFILLRADKLQDISLLSE